MTGKIKGLRAGPSAAEDIPLDLETKKQETTKFPREQKVRQFC